MPNEVGEHLYYIAKQTAGGLLIPSDTSVLAMAERVKQEPPSRFDERAVRGLAIAVKAELRPELNPLLC